VNRRGFALGLGAVLALPAEGVWGQASTTHRVAYLSSSSRSDTAAGFAALLDGLRELGYVEGRNLVMDAHWADYSAERTASLAQEIADLRPAVIITQGGGAQPATRLSPPIPVVFLQSGDPVEAGLADSYARPGRHATGVSLLALDMIGKRIELLQQMLPKLRRVALLANPQHPGEQRELAATRAAADVLRVEVALYRQARNPAELDAALGAVTAARPDAVMLFSDALMLGQRRVLAEFFLKHRIPSVAGWATFAESGHLLSYGPDQLAAWRRVASFVDRVLKGARPGDLPIELPTTIQTVVNRRTAAAMGLTVPPILLARADWVID
jgi:putative ABC transport system substrate-binding protein